MLLRTGRAVLTATVAAVLLAGCTGPEAAPSPRPEPQVTESAAPSPSPSVPAIPTSEPVVVPPEAPPELERTDEVGAAAAAKYFVSLYSYTLQSGDVTAWVGMSHEDCGFCSGIREDALQATSSGDRYEGGSIVLHEVEVLGRDDLIGGYPVRARYQQAREVHRGANGSIISETEHSTGDVRIDTLPSDSGWKILAVVVGAT